MSTFKTYDIVVVPFPFVDTEEAKKRPAIIISSGSFNDRSRHAVLAMVTSASHTSWPFDCIIANLNSAGLEKPSLIRLKLFTLDMRLILKKIGTLGLQDKEVFKNNFVAVFDALLNEA